MKNELFNASTLLDSTAAVLVASAADHVDGICDAIVAYNSHTSALDVTLYISDDTSPAAADTLAVVSATSTSTTNLIDGYQVPLKAGQYLYASVATKDLVYVRPMGKKASEGNVSGRAVLGS